LQVCNPELGTYCCRRDAYDCCSNSTITYTLGKAEPVTTIPHLSTHVPTHAPGATVTPQHPAMPTDAKQQGPPTYARDTMIGAGAGFAAAAAIFMTAGCWWISKRRRRNRDRKTAEIELGDISTSKLAIHKEVSVSVSAIEEPLSPAEIDAGIQEHEQDSASSAVEGHIEPQPQRRESRQPPISLG
jgi:hypothetical protein